jgi:hypothetical protein
MIDRITAPHDRRDEAPKAMEPGTGNALYLLIPGLIPPVEADAEALPTLPALERLLARAECTRDAPKGLEPLLFELFQAETEGGGDLPVAAVTRVLDLGVIDNGWWLRADPVHLRPERDRLILLDASLLDLTQDEAARLAAEIAEVFQADGFLLKAPRPGRWYLKPPRAPKLTTTPLPLVAGHDIHPYLPQGRDGMAWQTLLNEIQILLHSAKVNEERERRGKPPINSLWFWGGGRLPRLAPTAWTAVWSAEPLALAFARLAEIPSRALPSGFEAWRRAAAAERPGDHLVVLDHARTAVQYRDFETWAEIMTELEARWFAPLLEALRAGALTRVVFASDGGQRFRLTPKEARRWWRRRSLASHA